MDYPISTNKQELDEIINKMKIMVEAMKDPSLSDEDFTKYEADYEALEKRADRIRNVEKLAANATTISTGNEFRSLGEFVNAVVDL